MKQIRPLLKSTSNNVDIFQAIDQTIRKERLYAQVDLQREDIVLRFGIGRHRLNSLLSTYANGQSFPQYVNSIRMEECCQLFSNSPKMTITAVSKVVGLTPANLRNQFKRTYGVTPSVFRRKCK